ncbi:hypothetical protein LR48_Vigan530s000900 [Vigna angularis]|uniref:Uncharacterized protein n=1 Tax=Phaseolus angularis TaxID=3914 RepID=A0A0L9TCV7_PHAAN|nr:hypothetical protein LR48_Vigan530s000900 [Vigna angularis]
MESEKKSKSAKEEKPQVPLNSSLPLSGTQEHMLAPLRGESAAEGRFDFALVPLSGSLPLSALAKEGPRHISLSYFPKIFPQIEGKPSYLALASPRSRLPSLSPPSPRSRSHLPPLALASPRSRLPSLSPPLALASLPSLSLSLPPLALAPSLSRWLALSLSRSVALLLRRSLGLALKTTAPKSLASASPLKGRPSGGGASMLAAVLGGFDDGGGGGEAAEANAEGGGTMLMSAASGSCFGFQAFVTVAGELLIVVALGFSRVLHLVCEILF